MGNPSTLNGLTRILACTGMTKTAQYSLDRHVRAEGRMARPSNKFPLP